MTREKPPDDNVVNLDEYKVKKAYEEIKEIGINKEKSLENFGARKEFEAIGVDYYRKVKSFVENTEARVDEITLKKNKKGIKRLSDKNLLNMYSHFDPPYWLDRIELYKAVVSEVTDRYCNK